MNWDYHPHALGGLEEAVPDQRWKCGVGLCSLKIECFTSCVERYCFVGRDILVQDV